jgi:squalene cyclase
VTEVITEWIKDPSKITTAAILLLLIAGFVTDTIVPGPRYKEVKKRLDAMQAASDALLEQYRKREEEERLWRLAKQRAEGST